MSFRRHLCIAAAAGILWAAPLVRAQDAGAVDEKPVPIKTVQPTHPKDLKSKGISGIVNVSFTIDEQGNVVEPKVLKSTNPGFDAAALEAINQWKFKPAKKAGQPVKIKVAIPIKFELT